MSQQVWAHTATANTMFARGHTVSSFDDSGPRSRDDLLAVSVPVSAYVITSCVLMRGSLLHRCSNLIPSDAGQRRHPCDGPLPFRGSSDGPLIIFQRCDGAAGPPRQLPDRRAAKMAQRQARTQQQRRRQMRSSSS